MLRTAFAIVLLVQVTGASIAGSLVFNGDVAKPPANLSRARVVLAKPDDGERFAKVGAGLLPFTTLPGANVGEDGRFVIDGLVPGTYFINVAFIPQPWKLASAMYGGKDVAEEGLTIDEKVATPDSLTLTFSDRSTLVAGAVQVPDGSTPASCTVMAFPQNRFLWNIAGSRRKTVTAGPDGKYTIRDLPPGHYVMVAILNLEMANLKNPTYLDELSRSGVKITIGDGQRLMQNLLVTK
jgi:hypothetical protein